MDLRILTNHLSTGGFDDALSRVCGGSPREASDRILSLADSFEQAFGSADVRVASAPGRTELAGNHTDHQNGIVLCAAVTADALCVASASEDDQVVLLSRGFGEIRVTLDSLDPRSGEKGTSEGIIRGIAAGFAKRGMRVGGLRAVMDSQVPAGGGLSSSAAFEVLVGALFSLFYNNNEVDALTLAKIGQGAERDYFGKPSGLMDQAASACGGITMIDFGDPENVKVDEIAFDFRENGYVLCAVDTRTSHADLTEDYAAIPTEMRMAAAACGSELLRYLDPAVFRARLAEGSLASLPPRAILRAEHFFEENARVPYMAQALRDRNVSEYIRLMNASGASSREKLQNVVPSLHPEMTEMALALDRAAELLDGKGAWRIHGGGFAGCIQCLVPETDYPAFREKMDGFYGEGACFELRIRPCGVFVLDTE